MDTRSIVAHDVNEKMQQNQHGDCTIMTMGCFSAKVAESGVDPSSLGRWCWFKVGSGNKKTESLWHISLLAQDLSVLLGQPYENNMSVTLRLEVICVRPERSSLSN
jgi:hypothetical protein